MLSILFSEFKEWGCPNCGCDQWLFLLLTSGTCRHCKLTFEIRSDNGKGIVQYGSHPENPSDSESVMDHRHPRSGVSAWHWEPKDIRPEEGEYQRCWI